MQTTFTKDALAKALGPAGAGVASEISRTFDLMEIAERELKGNDRPGLFLALCPTGAIKRMSDEVYRSHARELIKRAKAKQKLAPATDAECLAALSETSLKAPLTQSAAACAEWLFARVLPGHGLGKGPSETWSGQVEEDVAVMRKKLAVADRDAS